MNGIISIDPGSKNHALSVLVGGQCVFTEMSRDTIYKLAGPELDDIIIRYSNYILGLIKRYQPRAVVIERFVVRGFAHNSIELVGFTCAIVKTICMTHNIECHLITAKQWKDPVKKALNLKQIYKEFKRKAYKIEPHTIDSLLMGRYLYNNKKFDERDETWLRETLINLKKKPRFKFYLAKKVAL